MFNILRKNKFSFDLSQADIIKRSRIIVIDDKEFEYIDLLKKDGYTVEKWTSNNDIDIHKLERNYYDIILLDMNGVATDRSPKHGLGLLEHIKTTNPAQIIIAYSEESFGLSSQQFIRQADACLEKAANYYDFKKKIDELLNKRFSDNYYEGLIIKIIQDSGLPHQRLEGAIKETIRSQKTDKLSSILNTINVSADTGQKILAIAETAIKVFSNG